MKVAFFDIKPFEKEYLEKNLPENFKPYYFETSLNCNTRIDESVSDCKIISVFTNSSLGNKVLSKFKNLKFIILRSSEFSHVDLLCAKKMGITVFNAPHFGDNSGAEFVFAALLSSTRYIFKAKQEPFKGFVRQNNINGKELYQKTMGIIGLGAIGKKVYRIAKSFDMNVFYYDIVQFEGYNYLPLDKLCKISDIITLTCPLTDKTLGLIDANKFELMKKGVVLINCSKGEIIKTEDLYNALIAEKAGFAALDTIECEDFLYNNKDLKDIEHVKEKCFKNFYITEQILNRDNVLITPNIAYNTIEAQKKILDITIENLISSIKFTSGAKNIVLI